MPSSSAPAPRSTPAAVAAQLGDYLARLAAAHAEASDRVGVVVRDVLLADHPVRFAVAGAELARVVLPAFEHLPPAPSGPPDGEFLLWDETASGVPLPVPPWTEPVEAPGVKIALPAGAEDYRHARSPEADTFVLQNLRSGRAVLAVRDANRLPFYQRASPLLLPVHRWAAARGLRAVHAGCVATAAGAALIAGPSGSGKSTTALLCALEGLDYLSDDYCLVRPGPAPRAYCLYHNAKLHRDHLARLPALAALATHPPAGSPDKPVVFLHRHHPERIRVAAPLRLILLPVVTGRPDTSAIRVDAAEAFPRLASSSIAQLPQDDRGLFFELAALARRLPCYRLDLGSRLETVAPAVRELLNASA